ncbi:MULTISPECIES: hypothetical protein [unclassified Luteimonas]
MRDGRTPGMAPWSFFLPVALAVLVGGVVAGLILRGIDGVSGNDDANPVAASPGSAEGEVGAPVEAADSARAEVDAAAAAPAPPEAVVPAPHAPGAASPVLHEDEDAVASVPSLPGAIVARRDGAPEACISGTIAWRDENGWQQRLENDAPVACVEASALAP